MDPSGFTFVNTSGGPSLSQPAARRMRAHINKTRRRRMKTVATGVEHEKPHSTQLRYNKSFASRRLHDPTPERRDSDDWLVKWVPSKSSADLQTFYKLQELCFLEGRHAPNSPGEAAWFHMIASEPALIEATMACSVGLMSPSNSWQIKAGVHLSNAVNLIKDRIMSTSTRTDGILAAVCTMAFSASLAQDELAWKVHIDGVTQIIRDRQVRGSDPILPWLTGLVIQDSVNHICGFPRVYHKQIITALNKDSDSKIQLIITVCEDIIQLRKVVDSHHKYHFDSKFVAREIEEPIATLLFQARSLRADDNPNLDSTARAIELLLYLLWPSKSIAHLALLAEQLRTSITKWPIKGCMFMDLTCFQLVIGAVAAEKGSSTRSWFLGKIIGAVRAMKCRGWVDPLHIMEARHNSDIGISAMFRGLWKELNDMCDVEGSKCDPDCQSLECLNVPI